MAYCVAYIFLFTFICFDICLNAIFITFCDFPSSLFV